MLELLGLGLFGFSMISLALAGVLIVVGIVQNLTHLKKH